PQSYGSAPFQSPGRTSQPPSSPYVPRQSAPPRFNSFQPPLPTMSPLPPMPSSEGGLLLPSAAPRGTLLKPGATTPSALNRTPSPSYGLNPHNSLARSSQSSGFAPNVPIFPRPIAPVPDPNSPQTSSPPVTPLPGSVPDM